jgi:hypothetical protein
MKRIITGCLALMLLGAVLGWVLPSSSRADGQQLQKTEAQIGAVVAEAKKTADAISRAAVEPDPVQARESLTRQTTELGRQKTNLAQLIASAKKDITAFDTSRSTSMAEYDEHLNGMTNTMYGRRQWERRKEQLYAESGKCVSEAKELIAEAEQILQQAGDLEHATAMLTIESTLRASMADLRSQMNYLNLTAMDFSRRATSFMDLRRNRGRHGGIRPGGGYRLKPGNSKKRGLAPKKHRLRSTTRRRAPARRRSFLA